MSKPLDVSLTMDEMALTLGKLVLQTLMDGKKIKVLEARVDELDPPEPEKADA